MNKHLKTAKSTLCSLASVLSSGVLMASNVSAASIEYFSGNTANNDNGTSTLSKDLGSSSGKDNKYRGIYTEGTINGVLDSGSVKQAGKTAIENIIKAGFAFNDWKVEYNDRGWKSAGIKTPGTSIGSTWYDLRAVAQWTDLKKAVFANGSTNRIVVGTPFEVKNDDDVKIGEISLDYIVNMKEGTKVEVDNIDEQITFTPDEANGYELKKVEVKRGEAEAVDMTEDVKEGSLELLDVKEEVNIDVKIDLKEFNVTATVTDEDGATVSPIPAVKYGQAATFDVAVNDGYKITGVLKDGEETELEVANGQLVIENVTADAEYTIVVEAEVYEIIEGDGQDIDVAEVDKALFRFDGPFDLFDGLTVDDKEFTAYEATEGSTLIAIAKDDLIALGEGEHDLKAFYANGTFAETTFTVSGIPTTPDTGANSRSASTIASVATFATTGAALALVMLAIKRKQNR